MGTRKTELDKAIDRLEAEKAAVQRSIDVLKEQRATKPTRRRKQTVGDALREVTK